MPLDMIRYFLSTTGCPSETASTRSQNPNPELDTVCQALDPQNLYCSTRVCVIGNVDAAVITGMYSISSLSRGNSVGIATGYVLNDQAAGVKCPGRVNNFHFSILSRPAVWPTQPPIQFVPEALSPGLKRPGYEAGPWRST
jgi:hypothetical protein